MRRVRLGGWGAWALTALAAVAARGLDLEAYLGRMPAESRAEQEELAAMVTAAPGEWAAALCARLLPAAAEADDTPVRYAIDGWTSFVVRPAAPPEERLAAADALATSLTEASTEGVQAFLLGQLAKVGDETVLPALLPYLARPALAGEAALAIRSLLGNGANPAVTDAAQSALPDSAGRHRAALLSLLSAPTSPPAEAPEAAGTVQPAHRVCADLTAEVDAHGDEALPAVLGALHHPSIEVRAHAERLFDALATPALAAETQARIEVEAADQRAGALRRLARHDPAAAVETARALLGDLQAPVRAAAREVYAAHAEPSADDEMLDLLVQADGPERDAIQAVLLRRPGPDLSERAAARLAANGEASARRALLAFLEASGARGQAGAALAAITDADPTVARQAAKTLRAIAGPEHATGLLEGLKNDQLEESLREQLVPALVGALGEIADTEARLAPIRAAWPDAAGAYRRFLQAALPGLEAGGGLELLAEDTRHPHPALRESAVRALCRWNGPGAIEPLLAAAETLEEESLHRLALDRCLQVIAQQADQASDGKEAGGLDQVRQWYESALAIARGEPERTRIQDAINALVSSEAADAADPPEPPSLP